jgi:hypothetical protein
MSISTCNANCAALGRAINCSSGFCMCMQGGSMTGSCTLTDPPGPRCLSCDEAFTQCCGW